MSFANSALARVDNWFLTQNQSLKPKLPNLSGILSPEKKWEYLREKRAVPSFEIKPYCLHAATLSGVRWQAESPDLEWQSCKIMQRAPKTTFYPMRDPQQIVTSTLMEQKGDSIIPGRGTVLAGVGTHRIYPACCTQFLPRSLLCSTAVFGFLGDLSNL